MARYAGTRRIAQATAIRGNRMTWTTVGGHIVWRREIKGHMLARKATARRYGSYLAALWGPVNCK